MARPRKNAKPDDPPVNQGGRPITRDKDQLAKELIEWIALDDSMNLNGFCASRKPPLDPTQITRYASTCENFGQVYKAVKAVIADRREKALTNGSLHVKAFELNSNVYDYFLKAEKREQAEFDASLKAKAEAIERNLCDVKEMNPRLMLE